ncbi:type II toxin-antitoxin system RelE/ParE family toxin, partial [Candidatus Gottesmanbacteria bacterium]|nr:type II toxin-antitoxin system RelE/ParE family toxin [Candidatus Gottesmanbacteria bacterium]
PEVEEKLRALHEDDNTRIVKVIDLFKDYGFCLSQPYLKKVASGLWELRAGRYRLLFGSVEDGVAIVYLFMKKTQKTPLSTIRLALKRLKQYET